MPPIQALNLPLARSFELSLDVLLVATLIPGLHPEPLDESRSRPNTSPCNGETSATGITGQDILSVDNSGCGDFIVDC